MKKYLSLMGLILSFNLYAHAAPLTLEEAYQMATEKTEAIPLQQSAVQEAQAREREAKGHFLPTVAFKVDHLRRDTNIGPSNRKDQTSSRINLTQSLYAGGRDQATTSAAQSDVNASRKNLAAERQLLYADVARSFYTALAAKKEVENIEASLSIMRKRMAELRERVRIGKSRTVDMLTTESQFSLLEAQLVAARGDLSTARDQLSQVTGVEQEVPLADEPNPPPAPNELKTYLVSVEERPDLQSLSETRESAERHTRAARAGHLPELGLSGNYYTSYSGPETTINPKPEWDVSVTLSVPLYSGGIISSQVREFKEKETQAELQLRQKRRAAETEVRTAYNSLMSSIEQIRSLEKAATVTEKNFKELERDYRYGVNTNLEVIQALITYNDTKRTLDRTRYQAQIAWAQLKVATAQVAH